MLTRISQLSPSLWIVIARYSLIATSTAISFAAQAGQAPSTDCVFTDEKCDSHDDCDEVAQYDDDEVACYMGDDPIAIPGTTGVCVINCPDLRRRRCLAQWALISTPNGPVPVSTLKQGDIVWSIDDEGKKVAVPIEYISSLAIHAKHKMVSVRLSDGRSFIASAGHPLTDGRKMQDLHVGDVYDGSIVASVEFKIYTGQRTWDLVPKTATAFYWADGVLLASTLKEVHRSGIDTLTVERQDSSSSFITRIWDALTNYFSF